MKRQDKGKHEADRKPRESEHDSLSFAEKYGGLEKRSPIVTWPRYRHPPIVTDDIREFLADRRKNRSLSSVTPSSSGAGRGR